MMSEDLPKVETAEVRGNMQLARVGNVGEERPIAIDADGEAWSLGRLTDDIDGAFLADGGLDWARDAVASRTLPSVDIAGLRLGSPIAQPDLVVCIGLNYRDHASETGAATPDQPIVFLKSPRTVIGPNDPITIPYAPGKTDWEVELAVIIGRYTHRLDSPADAWGHIAGFAISNDVSERALQLEQGGQWTKGKSCPSFNPLGPVLVPVDAVADPQNLGLRLWRNGELQQTSNTSNMIFGIAHLVWYLSRIMELDAGDIINTGTPAGVALGTESPAYLAPGDQLRLEIDGLGSQSQTVVEQTAPLESCHR